MFVDVELRVGFERHERTSARFVEFAEEFDILQSARVNERAEQVYRDIERVTDKYRYDEYDKKLGPASVPSRLNTLPMTADASPSESTREYESRSDTYDIVS